MKRSVKFEAEAENIRTIRKGKRDKPGAIDQDDNDAFDPNTEYNEEEVDAMDKDKTQQLPSNKELLESKRARRLKGFGDDEEGDTHIDQTTSLAAEKDNDVPIEAFHMKDEETGGEGYFDGDTYVFRKQQVRGIDEEPDAWLEGMSDKNQDLAKPSAVASTSRRSNVSRRSDEQSGNQSTLDSWSKEELFARLIPLVSDSETIMQALIRYGQVLKKTKDEDANKLAQKSLNDVTEAANALLLKGVLDIYELTRSILMKKLQSVQGDETKTPAAPGSSAPKVDVKWEYMGNQDNQIHGPYSTIDMLNWTKAGYFMGAQAVQIRPLERRKKPKTNTERAKEDLLNDLMDDSEDGAEAKADVAPGKANRGGNHADDFEVIKGAWRSSNDVDFTKYS